VAVKRHLARDIDCACAHRSQLFAIAKRMDKCISQSAGAWWISWG